MPIVYLEVLNSVGNNARVALKPTYRKGIWATADALLSADPKDAGWLDPGRGGCFSDGGENRKRPCVEISALIKDPQVVKINPEPSTTARLIAEV